ncbi:hypothetical protein BDR03DRAFT_940806 [Suillus americanus]|nr:hypothetical protein BDR03DRAFT_940806 [Suillus americanus]
MLRQVGRLLQGSHTRHRRPSHSSSSGCCFMIIQHLANLIRYRLVSGQEIYWLIAYLSLHYHILVFMIIMHIFKPRLRYVCPSTE